MHRFISLIIAIATAIIAQAQAEPALLAAGVTDIGALPASAHRLGINVRMAPARKGEASWSVGCGNLRVSIGMPDRRHSVEQYGTAAKVEVYCDGILAASKEIICDDEYASVKISYDGEAARVLAGFAEQEEVACGLPLSFCEGQKVEIDALQPMLCKRMSVMSIDRELPRLCPIGNIEERLAASADPIEGYWSYLDRDIDAGSADLGGKYRLAILGRPEGGYWIMYMGGAMADSGQWEPKMIKGIMEPTIFAGHYDLRWIDSRGVWLEDDNNAQISTDNAVLTLRFPLYDSILRFKRE